MKKLFSLCVVALLTCSAWAQSNNEGYKFTTVKANPITSVKNQASSGTCWCYSTVGFLESELLKMGKGDIDLSEMYIVRRSYEAKAQKYVRMHGNLTFGEGGGSNDVIAAIDEFGLMPQEAYQGLNYGEKLNKFGEIQEVMTNYLKAIVANKNGKLTTAWFNGFNGILDAYFGQVPAKFSYKGKEYTPQSFVKYLGLKSDDYVSLTSFTHHPFYKKFAVEVEDNWRWDKSYNLPIDELMQVFDNAINTGYTIAWGSDVSEIGFTRDGLAVMPAQEAIDSLGSDQAHWLGLSSVEKKRKLDATIKEGLEKGPVKQKEITQEMRQEAFDNYQTTDDHGMLIFGIAKDQMGNKYYMVKNSWGEIGKYKGIWYASDSFVKYKTMDIIVNKKAIPQDIRKKLGI